MVVNALVTGLIVFKILKVVLEIEATSTSSSSVKRTFFFFFFGLGVNPQTQASVYHIRNNRIRYGVVCHPTGSRRAFLPASAVAAA
jgi:hypothetical protein